MNTIEDQIDSTETANRWRPLLDESTPAKPRDPVASQSVELRSNRGATTVPSRAATTWVNRLARDADSSNLVNFPFAFTTTVILITGLSAIGWGSAVTSVWLTVVGFLLTLVAGVLHGWSLSDE